MLHHNFPKGTRILIIFRDGTKLDCKFWDRKARHMVTDKGEFLYKSMRATTIFKHPVAYDPNAADSPPPLMS